MAQDTLEYLVEIDNSTLRSLGMTAEELEVLKRNKLRREEEALAIIKQSGVPSSRWPTFRSNVYYLDRDFSGSLAKYIPQVRARGTMLKGTSYYANINQDGTRTEYPFTTGTYYPSSNKSPVQNVVEILTDGKGNLLLTEQNKIDLRDMVNFITSSSNVKRYSFSIDSKVAPYYGGEFHSSSEVINDSKVSSQFAEIADRQATKVESIISGMSSQIKPNEIFVNLDGAAKARNVNTSGVALSKDGGTRSSYYKYNNVVLVSLYVSAFDPNKGSDDLVVDYDYIKQAEDKAKSIAADESGESNYQKFYQDTRNTTVMPVSGVNIQVVFEFPSNDNHKSVYLYMPDMITVSHSVHRAKIPVTVLGDTTISGLGLGTKMVAGSIVKVFTRRDTFHNYIKLFVDERSSTMSQERKASLVTLQSNISMNEMSDHMRDDLGPFNIHLISMSEYDCVYRDPPKVDSILGCTIINTGKVYSIENLITEETLSFMAKTVVYQDDISAKVSKTLPSDSITTGSTLLQNFKGA